MKVAIFGAGIGGLTAAHYLVKSGFQVTVYERTRSCGGVAKSEESEQVIQSEVSWRGYGPFYHNFHNLAKEIKNRRGNLLDSISRPMQFVSPDYSSGTVKPKISIKDYPLLLWHLSKVFMSDRRRKKYSKVDFVKKIENKISPSTYKKTVAMLGPGLGLDVSKSSVYSVGKAFNARLPKSKQWLKDKKGEWLRKNDSPWSVLKGPTSHEWFDPWKGYLESKGVAFHFNHELKDISVSDNLVTGCSVVDIDNHQVFNEKFDYVVAAINPFAFQSLLDNNQGLKSHFKDFNQLIADGPDDQIGFQILFNKKINLEKANQVINLPDSPFVITICPQDHLWDVDNQDFSDKSLWSGTITNSNAYGLIYKDKRAIEMTKAELYDEITAQILKSASLKAIIEKHSNITFNDRVIDNIALWSGWEYSEKEKKLVNSLPKWVTTFKTEEHRPKQKTSIKNLFLAGAHTDTSLSLYSMEAAVESGIKAAQHIIDANHLDYKIPVVEHSGPKSLNIIKRIDNWFYDKKLPLFSHSFFVLISVLAAMATIYKAT